MIIDQSRLSTVERTYLQLPDRSPMSRPGSRSGPRFQDLRLSEAERDQEVGAERGRDRDSQKDFIFSDDETTPEPMNEVGGMRNHEMIMESTSDTHLAPGQPEALLKNRPDKQLSAIDESRGSPLRDSQVSYQRSHIHVTTTEPCIDVRNHDLGMSALLGLDGPLTESKDKF